MDCLDEGAGQPLDDGSLTLDIAASRGEGARRREDLQLDGVGEKPAAGSLYGERGQAGQRPDIKFARDHRGGDLRVAAQSEDSVGFVGGEGARRLRVLR